VKGKCDWDFLWKDCNNRTILAQIHGKKAIKQRESNWKGKGKERMIVGKTEEFFLWKEEFRQNVLHHSRILPKSVVVKMAIYRVDLMQTWQREILDRVEPAFTV
jgi:hypothetical protein